MVHQNFCAAVVADESVATARKVVRRSHPHRHSANRARSRWRRWDTNNDYLQEWPVSRSVNSSRTADDDPTLVERIDAI
jgi:hypothetical protein